MLFPRRRVRVLLLRMIANVPAVVVVVGFLTIRLWAAGRGRI